MPRDSGSQKVVPRANPDPAREAGRKFGALIRRLINPFSFDNNKTKRRSEIWRTQSAKKNTQEDGKASFRTHVQPNGLEVTTELLEWPPRTQADERIEIKRYLNGSYEARREKISTAYRRMEIDINIFNSARRSLWKKALLWSLVPGLLAVYNFFSAASAYYWQETHLNWGLLFAAVAGFMFYRISRGPSIPAKKHSDEEHPSLAQLEQLYDKALESDMAVLWRSGLRMIAEDKAGNPGRVLGPYLNFPNYDEIKKPVFTKGRIGSDGRLRFTPRSIYYLSFHDNQVITYEAATDIVEGKPIYHKLREFSYQDITAITRVRRTKDVMRIAREMHRADDSEVDDLEALETTQEVIQLDLINGSNVAFVLDDAYLASRAIDVLVPQSESDQVVEAIRAMVRDKKRFALNSPQSANNSTNPAFHRG
jgi:hypothetical protein